METSQQYADRITGKGRWYKEECDICARLVPVLPRDRHDICPECEDRQNQEEKVENKCNRCSKRTNDLTYVDEVEAKVGELFVR